MSKKIIIYNQNYYCGGALVLSALCKHLRTLGYDARVMFPLYYSNRSEDSKLRIFLSVFYTTTMQYMAYLLSRILPKATILSKYKLRETEITTMPGIKIQYNPFFNRRNTIVVYPEIINGNPLFATHVMRWFLSFYSKEKDNKAYHKRDFFVCYREVFNNSHLNPEKITLQVPYFNDVLYKRYNYGKRSGKCYIIYKGRNRKDLPSHFDGPYFDNNMTQEELVKMLNEHEYCYSYDTQTFYNAIASLCGCKTIVVMEPGKRMEDYLGEGERKHYGVAWGDTPEQIAYAESTRDKLIERINEININSLKNVEQFIPILENRFGELKKITK